MRLQPGQPYPLGATLAPGGVNFAVYSAHASAVTLCLFDPTGQHEVERLPLPAQTDGVWHGFLPGAGAGQLYGYRVNGPYEPERGHRFNPNKLLLDPYAREIVGTFAWLPEHFGYAGEHPHAQQHADQRDNAALMLKARVAAPLPPAVAAPQHALRDTVIYELHVKGFTRLMPALPESLRGTYAGLASEPARAHLRRLGITAVSLQPVHYSLSEQRLQQLGLSNYWGYNTLGFFALDPRLSATPHDPAATRAEFRALVDALHADGIEVLLDVVYNHTAEGDERGPTLSWRGLDNRSYYRLTEDDRSRYENLTGCGNTLNIAHPRVTQLVLDSLRYWVTEMGVDGFRFDLAPVLGRTTHGFDAQAAFFVALLQDPVLARVKLIAEPWDVGHHGYQLGRFPDRFLEWNDQFRDDTRRFWLRRGSHEQAGRGEFARRLAGSSDRFHHGHRRPTASVNYVASHDGFTLHDLVSYTQRHNEANGEHNRDGHSANFSDNSGVEGPSADPQINAARARRRRALLASVLLAQGTPMLLAGDELGRTQRGNNNAYCQDNAVSWIDWAAVDEGLLGFVSQLIALRQALPALRQDRWLDDAPDETGRRDVQWRSADGRDMTVDDWHDPQRHHLAVWLTPREGNAVLLLINAEDTAVNFTLPEGAWWCRLDTATASFDSQPITGATREVAAQAIQLLAAVPN